jgi:hypothetical protein
MPQKKIQYDIEVFRSGIGEIAGQSWLEGLGGTDDPLEFDPPTAEDIYVAAICLASDITADGISTVHNRKLERVTMWLCRVANNNSYTIDMT